MHSKRARLDRFLSIKTGINRKAVRAVLAQGRVIVDGHIATNIQQLIDEFCHVTFDSHILQADMPHYVMMNKPVGVVSATKDEQHKTVIDLLDRPNPQSLHLVGRLDFNSTGLLLLTNDGRWSRRLMEPANKVSKRYQVRLQKPISQATVQGFAKGLYFGYEDIITRPAKLDIISDYVAEVTLIEGRYHQIKRMFGHFDNQVLALHRLAIGNLTLDSSLTAGQSRELSNNEINTIMLQPC